MLPASPVPKIGYSGKHQRFTNVINHRCPILSLQPRKYCEFLNSWNKMSFTYQPFFVMLHKILHSWIPWQLRHTYRTFFSLSTLWLTVTVCMYYTRLLDTIQSNLPGRCQGSIHQNGYRNPGPLFQDWCARAEGQTLTMYLNTVTRGHSMSHLKSL